MKSFTGCWTCRLRRKKCDEAKPECNNCSQLRIKCEYDVFKPDYMDGGRRQAEKAAEIRQEIKEQARLRREARGLSASWQVPEDTTEGYTAPSTAPDEASNEPGPSRPRTTKSRSATSVLPPDAPAGLEWPEASLMTFYVENYLPSIFPSYHPPLADGGRSWILGMLLSSPLSRGLALNHSAYFHSLIRGSDDADTAREKALSKTQELFAIAIMAIKVIQEAGFAQNIRKAMKLLHSIVQDMHFELSVSSFRNWQLYLGTSVGLWKDMMLTPIECPSGTVEEIYLSIIDSLALPRPNEDWPNIQIPGVEQAAFRFTTAVLLVDNILASTATRDPPQLYEYYSALLGESSSGYPLIDLQTVLGCENWVFLHLGEIAALAAWKKQRLASNLDMAVIQDRGAARKAALMEDLTAFESRSMLAPSSDALAAQNFVGLPYLDQAKALTAHIPLITRIWAHATLLYILTITISTGDSLPPDQKFLVHRILDLITRQLPSPVLLRAVAWPFCLAGCLADQAHKDLIRGLVGPLRGLGMHGTLYRALDCMERVWAMREAGDGCLWEAAFYLQYDGVPMLFV